MSKVGERVAFSPGEFASLFGKQQTWGYRQIYAGKVKAVTKHGRILIPASEIERILATATRYEGMNRPPVRTKVELQSMKPALQSAWRAFVLGRRGGKQTDAVKTKTGALPPSSAKHPNARMAVLSRLAAGKDRPRVRSV